MKSLIMSFILAFSLNAGFSQECEMIDSLYFDFLERFRASPEYQYMASHYDEYDGDRRGREELLGEHPNGKQYVLVFLGDSLFIQMVVFSTNKPYEELIYIGLILDPMGSDFGDNYIYHVGKETVEHVVTETVNYRIFDRNTEEIPLADFIDVLQNRLVLK